METRTAATLREVGRLLDRLDGAERVRISDEERLSLVKAAQLVSRRVQALERVLIAEADRAGSAKKAAGAETTSWLARQGDLSSKEAAGLVFGGRDLAASPQTRDAALAGVVSVEQARAVEKTMNAMPEGLNVAQQSRARELLIASAKATPARDLLKLGDTVLAAVAPELIPDPADEAAKLALQRKRALAERHLVFKHPVDGSVAFSGSLPVVEATQWKSMITSIVSNEKRRDRNRAADRLDPLSGSDRTLLQRQADALMTLVTSRAARWANTETTPTSSATRGPQQTVGSRNADSGSDPLFLSPHSLTASASISAQLNCLDSPAPASVMVVMNEQALRDRAEQAGLLVDGTKIGAGELRRLCCDAELVPIVLGSKSEILDLGTAVRLVTPELRRALVLRDKGCVFPGCDVPPEACEAHHIDPWWAGGPTALHNLALLCPHHHGLLEPLGMHPPGHDARGDHALDQTDEPGQSSHRGEVDNRTTWEPRPDPMRWTIHMGPDGRPHVLEPTRITERRARLQGTAV